jgi:hypothetical protein
VQHTERHKPEVRSDVFLDDLRYVSRRRLFGVVEHRSQAVSFCELDLLQSTDVISLELIWRHECELNFELLTEHLKLKLLLNSEQVFFSSIYSDDEHHIGYSG